MLRSWMYPREANAILFNENVKFVEDSIPASEVLALNVKRKLLLVDRRPISSFSFYIGTYSGGRSRCSKLIGRNQFGIGKDDSPKFPH